jgi:acid phosphatase family membrane protein YuiD
MDMVLLVVGEMLLVLIIISMFRSNSIRQDNTAQLRALNRNISNFNEREDLIAVIKELNKKIKELN